MLTVEEVKKALETVNYPGYSRSIVSFNIIKDIRIEDSAVNIELQLTTSKEDVVNALTNSVKRVVGHLSDNQVAIKVSTPEGVQQGNNIKDPFSQRKNIPGIKNIIAVASGKGGVGKSTVSVNLACALAQKGMKVGLLDCDIYGPSIPLLFGVTTQPQVTEDECLIPIEKYGVKLMSIGFLVPKDEPIIWRGPLIMKTVQQFLEYVVWGDLDYLIVDLPPGTGDAQLSLCQTVPLSGGVVVTTPQEASVEIVRKGIGMLEQVKVPVLGIVENMSYYTTPQGEKVYIFGANGGKLEADRKGCALLGEIPLFVEIREGGDKGVPIVVAAPQSAAAKCFAEIAEKLL